MKKILPLVILKITEALRGVTLFDTTLSFTSCITPSFYPSSCTHRDRVLVLQDVHAIYYV